MHTHHAMQEVGACTWTKFPAQVPAIAHGALLHTYHRTKSIDLTSEGIWVPKVLPGN